MADNSISTVPYKRSDNQKADLVQRIFKEYKIAIQTMKRHGIIDEFVCAVKGGANLPAPEPTAPIEESHHVLSISNT
jgi:hypothetical protein